MKRSEDQRWTEFLFETGLWSTRYVIILGVVFSILSAIALFIAGSWEIVHAIQETLYECAHNKCQGIEDRIHHDLVPGIINAIGLYLIGVVLMIFGFGIYELFISKIDIARDDRDITILEIKDLDELKNKIIKVIIMVLIVTFFQKVTGSDIDWDSAQNMMYLAISIFALSLGVYFLKKHN